ncbi:MAG: sodium/proline symporter [Cognaticolwellia sp.]|jgi:sodium/proline symporter
MNTLQLDIDGTALWAFLAYLIALFAIGIYASKFSSKGISEYFVGGRQLNKYVVALSAVVSGRSAWLLLAFSALAYNIGIAAFWAAIGYILIELWMFLYYAPKLRRFSEVHNVITVPDFYVAKFGDKNNLLRIITVLVITTFMIAYVSSQFVAGGKTFAASFDISQTQGILISAVIILLYTLAGGFLAVSMTDVVQAFFMLFSLVVVPLLAIWSAGGWEFIHADLLRQKPDFFDPFSIALGSICGFVGIGLGSFGSPHIMVRYMSIKDADSFKTVAIVGTFWNVIMALGALFVGFAARVYFPSIGNLPAGDVENAFPTLAKLILNPTVFGIVVASIFAAIMSTADSQLLVAASGLVRDIYQKIIKKEEEIPNKKLMLYSRLSVLVMVILALILGFVAEKQIFWLVLFAWGGLGAAIGSTSLLALFWDGMTRQGAIAGILTGTFSIFIWKNVPFLNNIIYELIPTFFLAMLVTILVSKFSQKDSD